MLIPNDRPLASNIVKNDNKKFGAVEKVFLTTKYAKDCAKYAKLKH
jgi:hypothetical protein